LFNSDFFIFFALEHQLRGDSFLLAVHYKLLTFSGTILAYVYSGPEYHNLNSNRLLSPSHLILMDPLKVTVITTVYNGQAFIRDAVESVLSQTYPNVEYIVKDAGSTDGTAGILKEYQADPRLKIISEKDKGMYDGLNQGIALATGDIIAHLNSDDFYTTKDAVSHMVKRMQETGAAAAWGDVCFVDRNTKSRIVRRFKSSSYASGKFGRGWHPPHTGFFARRSLYEKYGTFRTDMRVAADYELMLRFLERYHVPSCYLPETVVTMRAGGASGSLLGRLWEIRKEDARAWEVNGLRGGFLTAWFLKPISKISQLFM
jgi:glycosyltransferase involved in cell wall biosynthesis